MMNVAQMAKSAVNALHMAVRGCEVTQGHTSKCAAGRFLRSHADLMLDMREHIPVEPSALTFWPDSEMYPWKSSGHTFCP